LYIVAGSKEIIAEFSSRRRSAKNFQVVKPTSISSQLVDDSYYVYKQHAKKQQSKGGSGNSGSKKKKKGSKSNAAMTELTPNRKALTGSSPATAKYEESSEEEGEVGQWHDGDGQRTKIPSS
jgi:hypothetical protein